MSKIVPRLTRLGRLQSPVVTLDGLPADWAALVDAAAAMAPLPAAQGSYYPGLRRIFSPVEATPWALAADLAAQAAPYVAGAFDCDGFTLMEASFSMVTTPPGELEPAQRHPHFDSTDPDFVALIGYLFDAEPGDGTAFYRHKESDIEVVTENNCDRFIAAAKREAASLSGYFGPGDPGYTLLGGIDAAFGRIGIWRGNVLHSGLVSNGHSFSPDPRVGRLTINLFLQLTRD